MNKLQAILRQFRGTRGFLVLVIFLLALHGALVLRVFPPSMLFRGDVPIGGDAPRYLASVHGVAKLEASYGYDGDFMAGYPVGLWNSMGKRAYELLYMVVPTCSLD